MTPICNLKTEAPGGRAVLKKGGTGITFAYCPNRSMTDCFGQDGQRAGTLAWPLKAPRKAANSAVSVWTTTKGVKIHIDIWAMGCGWLKPLH
jgi:hypothetical protein